MKLLRFAIMFVLLQRMSGGIYGQELVLEQATYFDIVPKEVLHILHKILVHDLIILEALWQRPSLLNLTGHTDPLSAAHLDTEGIMFATASYNNTVEVWKVGDGIIATLTGHVEAINSIKFDSQGTRVVTASWDRTAKIWNVSDGFCVVTITGHTGPVNSALFDPQGTKIVTASSNDISAKIWKVVDGSLIVSLEGHVAGINSAQFDCHGALIVTASNDGLVKIWKALDGSCIATLNGHAGSFSSAQFQVKGTRSVKAYTNGIVKIWKRMRPSFKQAISLLALHAHDGAQRKILFQSGQMLALQKKIDFLDALIQVINLESSQKHICSDTCLLMPDPIADKILVTNSEQKICFLKK